MAKPNIILVDVDEFIATENCRVSLPAIAELAQTLRVTGVVDPLWAYREGSRWVVVDGHRRLAACQTLAKRDEAFRAVPVREVDRRRALPLQHPGNSSAHNWNLLDVGVWARRMRLSGFSAQEVADAARSSVRHIQRALRVEAELAECWRDVLRRGYELSSRELIRLSQMSEEQQRKAFTTWQAHQTGSLQRKPSASKQPKTEVPISPSRLERALAHLKEAPPAARRVLRYLTNRGGRRPDWIPKD